jgi:hypothetical protein
MRTIVPVGVEAELTESSRTKRSGEPNGSVAPLGAGVGDAPVGRERGGSGTGMAWTDVPAPTATATADVAKRTLRALASQRN